MGELFLECEALGQRQAGSGPYGLDGRQRRLTIRVLALGPSGHACKHFLAGRARIDSHLTGAARSAPGRQQLIGEGEGARCQIAIDDRIDDAPLERLRGADRLRGENQFERLFGADQARHALRTARPRDDAEGHFRQSEPCSGCCHAVMAREGKFQAAAEGSAVQHRDHRHRERLEPSKQCSELRFLRRAVKLADIGTGEKCLAGAQQHERAWLWPGILLQAVEGSRQLCTYRC